MLSFKSNINKETFVLIFSTLIAGVCSIIYELLISTASSYFLGDSIKQFSITIGIYMAAMGIGSYFSRLIQKNLLSKFIALEILLGFLGGISIPILYCAYAYTSSYSFIMFLLILSIGVLIGLEIPLLTRIMEKYYTLKVNISNILSLDYFGALIATLIFPFILLPLLGTFRSSLFFGIINMSIGFVNLWCFSEKLKLNEKKIYKYALIIVSLIMTSVFIFSHIFIREWSNSIYEDRIVLRKQTKYQKLILTKNKDDIRLYINGNLQFSSLDEYRYHEALIHVPLSIVNERKNILILGGGDGLAVRELLKYNDVEKITVVDLDPGMTDLAIKNIYLKKLNNNSLQNYKVNVLNIDAFNYLKESKKIFNVIISDLPDPNNTSLARLYSKEFYIIVKNHLTESGIFVAQSTSPFFAKKAFWCIHNTIKEADFLKVMPYHVYVPSFGEWGYVLASKVKPNLESAVVNVQTKYLDNNIISKLFLFEKDLIDLSPEYSSIDNPKILKYYLNGWKYWN